MYVYVCIIYNRSALLSGFDVPADDVHRGTLRGILLAFTTGCGVANIAKFILLLFAIMKLQLHFIFTLLIC